MWCSGRTVSIAAIEILETSLAGGINESGLRQDRCEGQRGQNPRGSHLYASRWLVEDVIVGENVSLQRKSPPGGFARSLSTSHHSRDPPPFIRSCGSLRLGGSCVFLLCSPVCSTWQLCFLGQSSLSRFLFVFPFLFCPQVREPGCCNLQRTWPHKA